MCVFLISPVPITEPLTSELIDTPVFHNLAPRPIKYRVSVLIPIFYHQQYYQGESFSKKFFFFTQVEDNETVKRIVSSHDISQDSETILWYHHIWPNACLRLQFSEELGLIFI